MCRLVAAHREITPGVKMGKKVVIVYKGLRGEAERSPDDNSYRGIILDTPHEISFEGATISELQLSFTQAVDNYRGETGNRQIKARVAPETNGASDAVQASI